MNLLFFGPPGAGKGTQSTLLVDKYNMAHVSTGDIFRHNIKNETPLGLEAKKYMDGGNLVPDSVTIAMFENHMDSIAGQEFILDGFPRTVPQAEALSELLNKKSLNIDKVLFLEVPQEQLLRRLTGRRVCKACGATYHIDAKPPKSEGICDKCEGEVIQRPDDEESAIQTRLDVYAETTRPVKDYYQAQGKVVEIDGTGTADEVFSRIEQVLN